MARKTRRPTGSHAVRPKQRKPESTKPIRRPADEKELHALADIGALAFSSPPERVRAWLSGLGLEVTRVYQRRGEVLAGLVLHPAGQWFGGRCVPMTGVALVCVAPQHRASGIGSKLMRTTLQEMHADGVPLSTLYASTVPLYRGVGYEAAGGLYEITLPPKTIPLRDRELTLREAQTDDWPAMDEAYRRRVAFENGPLDQQAPEWRRVLRAGIDPQNPMPRSYAVWSGRRVEGYIRYLAKREDRTLRLTDLVATTPRAGRRLLSFLADHRMGIDSIVWLGAPTDPLLLLLPERSHRVRLAGTWLMRVVDVPRALEARGYPAEVEAAIQLKVEDELLPANRGPFLLEVSGGRAKVRRGARAARGASHRGGLPSAKIDVRGLSALYSAHLSADQLAMTDYLEATPAGVAALRSIFTGSAPWMSDSF
jgi:predicted acetyltransferase